ncbi:MAG: class I SAM-dependent methyltransferase [Clostridia bacterium]|nr:class I SAM-dependent methyltransferase [Clostridia bacterium]
MKEYQKYLSVETLMGPNSLRLLEELLSRFPPVLSKDDIVLDLGCGKGLTTLAITRETPAKAYACDLWITAEENTQRFAQWGIGDRAVAFHEDANDLHFSKHLFQALISVDAYHYFAGTRGFFDKKMLPLLKDGAEILIAIPGMKAAYTGQAEALLSDWLGNDAYMFKSMTEWRDIIGTHERIDRVDIWEMDCFESAWNDWFSTEHEFALSDKPFFETLIRPYTCFIGIRIRLK